MSWNFVALDVETANGDSSSICQIGIVEFAQGQIVNEVDLLIDPETHFDGGNIAVHGITPDHVIGKPTFGEVYSRLEGVIGQRIVLHHGPFDSQAFAGAYANYGLTPIESKWLNNFNVVRHTWEQFFNRGYALANLAAHFDLALDHHDALSDARVAGQVACLAFAESGLGPQDWVDRL